MQAGVWCCSHLEQVKRDRVKMHKSVVVSAVNGRQTSKTGIALASTLRGNCGIVCMPGPAN